MTEGRLPVKRLRTGARYALFQIPGTLVAGLILLAAAELGWVTRVMAAVLLAVWIAKDVLLYPLLKRAYDTSDGANDSRWIGRIGRVREDLDPHGYVNVAGELWRAEAMGPDLPIRSGERVRVEGVEGLCLKVRRAQGDGTSRST